MPSGTNTGNAYNAALDSNQYPTLTAVSGTVGTADTTGTAEIVRVGVNPTTGALYVDTSTTPGGNSSVGVVSGTLQTLGTVGVLNAGSVVVTAGTVINTGTNVNVVTGTMQSSGTVTGVGVVSNLTNGSVNVLTGTIQSSGTVTGVGVVSGLTTGTVNVLAVGTVGGKAASGAASVANPVQIAGTDAGGTIYSPLVTTGGVMAANMPTGTITTGSLSNVAVVGTVTGAGVVTTVSNLTNGSVNILTGTLQSSGTTTGVGVVSNLTMGSVVLHGQSGGANKILSVGTGSYGSILTVSTPHDASAFSDNYANNPQSVVDESYNQVIQGVFPMVFNGATWDRYRGYGVNGTTTHVHGTTGAAVWGTLVAASGAGTKQYVTGLSIVVVAGTVDVAVTNIGVGGSAGAGVIARGFFPPGGGIARDFTNAVVSGTNGTLAYWLGGAGTVDISIQYAQAI